MGLKPEEEKHCRAITNILLKPLFPELLKMLPVHGGGKWRAINGSHRCSMVIHCPLKSSNEGRSLGLYEAILSEAVLVGLVWKFQLPIHKNFQATEDGGDSLNWRPLWGFERLSHATRKFLISLFSTSLEGIIFLVHLRFCTKMMTQHWHFYLFYWGFSIF